MSEYKCSYEGSLKAWSGGEYGNTTCLMCIAHTTEWLRQFPYYNSIKPRKVIPGFYVCEADWPLPSEVP